MIICILCHREPNPLMGGIERVSYSLAKELLKRNILVFFVCAIRVNINHYDEKNISYILPDYLIDSNQNVQYLSSLLQEHQCSIILNQAANHSGFVDLCSAVRATSSSINIVSAIHFAPHQEWISLKCNKFLSKGNDPKSIKFKLAKGLNDLLLFTKKRKIQKDEVFLLRKICQNSAAVVVLSDAYVEEFRCMAQKNNIIAIPNMIGSSDLSISLGNKEKTVLYVGRLEYGLKRVDRLLHIWKDIEKSFPDWKLQIVGDGDYRYILEYVSNQLGLKRVSFEGPHSPEEYYRKASIISLTSSCEGFGMVLVEAMQYGCVPVAYNSYAALADIVEDGVNGSAVTAFNKKEYVTKLSQLMRDNDMRRKMADAALLVPPKFDAHLIAQKWVNLFESLS